MLIIKTNYVKIFVGLVLSSFFTLADIKEIS